MKIIRDFNLDRLTINIYHFQNPLLKGDSEEFDPALKTVFNVLGISEEDRKKKKDGTFSRESVYFKNGIKVYRSFEKIEVDFSGEFLFLTKDPSIMIHSFFEAIKPLKDSVNIRRIDGCRDLEGLTFSKIFSKDLRIKSFKKELRVKHANNSIFSPVVGAVINNSNMSFVVYDKIYSINQVESEKNTAYKSFYGDKKILRCEIQYFDKDKNNRLFKEMLFEKKDLQTIAKRLFKDFYKIHPAVNEFNEIRECYFNKILKPLGVKNEDT